MCVLHAIVQFSETEGVVIVALNAHDWSPLTISVAITRTKGYQELPLVDEMTKHVMYFAYGSNLLAQRIHINIPSAVRKEIGKLEASFKIQKAGKDNLHYQGYRLDFGGPYSNMWGGYPATVVPHTGKQVWGAIWEIENSYISDLDRQEGVHQNIYFPIEVCIETPSGRKVVCRSYQLCRTPEALENREILPKERQPSEVYLAVIIKGAIESALPSAYIEELKYIPNNGNQGTMETPISFPREFS